MRAAFCGKGGSGKSTLASLFSRYLAQIPNTPVLAIDGDINQHLGESLGFSTEDISALPKLGVDTKPLVEYIKGKNSRIESVDHMTNTTPATRESNFLYLQQDNVVFQHYTLRSGNLKFMAIGGHDEEMVGKTCYHHYLGYIGVLLNHLLDGKNEYVIGDMVAGADPFASNYIGTRFDIAFLVVEPTLKSVGVFEQCREYAEPYGVKLKVIGNKIENDDDKTFLQEHLGDHLLGFVPRSQFVRDAEKGIQHDLSELEPEILNVLETMKVDLDTCQRDWKRYQEVGIHFHKLAAESWANDLYKTDMMQQIDPDFRYEDIISTQKQSLAA